MDANTTFRQTVQCLSAAAQATVVEGSATLMDLSNGDDPAERFDRVFALHFPLDAGDTPLLGRLRAVLVKCGCPERRTGIVKDGSSLHKRRGPSAGSSRSPLKRKTTAPGTPVARMVKQLRERQAQRRVGSSVSEELSAARRGTDGVAEEDGANTQDPAGPAGSEADDSDFSPNPIEPEGESPVVLESEPENRPMKRGRRALGEDFDGVAAPAHGLDAVAVLNAVKVVAKSSETATKEAMAMIRAMEAKLDSLATKFEEAVTVGESPSLQPVVEAVKGTPDAGRVTPGSTMREAAHEADGRMDVPLAPVFSAQVPMDAAAKSSIQVSVLVCVCCVGGLLARRLLSTISWGCTPHYGIATGTVWIACGRCPFL
jgi:hypothetical protein